MHADRRICFNRATLSASARHRQRSIAFGWLVAPTTSVYLFLPRLRVHGACIFRHSSVARQHYRHPYICCCFLLLPSLSRSFKQINHQKSLLLHPHTLPFHVRLISSQKQKHSYSINFFCFNATRLSYPSRRNTNFALFKLAQTRFVWLSDV
jgi:hypothetical protein